jgi:hypothetical protein
MNKLEVLADYYPIKDILEQNDIEAIVVLQFLSDEGLINVEDYFYEDELVDD